jgi:hypothetical protein
MMEPTISLENNSIFRRSPGMAWRLNPDYNSAGHVLWHAHKASICKPQDAAAAACDAVARRLALSVRYEPETSAAGLTSFSPPLNPAQKNSSTANEAIAGTIQMDSQL